MRAAIRKEVYGYITMAEEIGSFARVRVCCARMAPPPPAAGEDRVRGAPARQCVYAEPEVPIRYEFCAERSSEPSARSPTATQLHEPFMDICRVSTVQQRPIFLQEALQKGEQFRPVVIRLRAAVTAVPWVAIPIEYRGACALFFS